MKKRKRNKAEAKTRDRKATEEKLIRTTGDLFRKNGYQSLKTALIAREAGVDRNLIYRYFGDVAELFKRYLFGQDFWMGYQNNLDDMIESGRHDDGKSLAKNLLVSQLKYFSENSQMQELIHWEISESNQIGRGISDERERMGEEMFVLTEKHFDGGDVNFRAVQMILIAGVYYMVLHAKTNGSTFCGLDINNKDQFAIVEKTLQQMVDWAYYFGNGSQSGGK